MAVEEIWRPVVGFEALREVSNQGRVRCVPRIGAHGRPVPGGLAKLADDGQGYRCIAVYDQGRRRKLLVHDLVAAAFLGSRPGGAWVHHIDGTRDNNQVSNLEYIDAHKHKVMSTQGARSSSAKLTEQDVREIRRMYAAGAFSYDVLGDLYGVHPSNIHLIVHRCTWKYLE